jgi:VWFA-related protein
MTKLSVSILLTVIVLCLAMFAYPQSSSTKGNPAQDQAVQLQTELIQVHAVVTDKQGNIIRGLTKDDFEILENKKRQEISFFSTDSIGPVNRSASSGKNAAGDPLRPVSPIGVTTPKPSRTVVLYVDTLHLSVTSLMQTKLTLSKFVDQQLTDEDVVAIITSTGSLGILEQFTSDRRILHLAINKLSPGPGFPDSMLTPYLAGKVKQGDAEALALAVDIVQVEDHLETLDIKFVTMFAQAKANELISETAYRRRSSLYTLKAVAERMTEMPGQRIIAVLSDGFSLVDSSGTTDRVDLDSTISRAVRSGVVIYAIDTKGLTPPGGYNASTSGINSTYAGPLLHSLTAAEIESRAGLDSMAHDTGGEFLHNNNDIGGLLKKALDQNQFYYTLAYYPAGNEKSRIFRSITIKVKDHPEYNVRTQSGYSPEDFLKAKKNEPKTPVGKLFRAIASPLPETGIGVMATASYYGREMDPSIVFFQAHIDGNNIEYKEQNEHHHFYLELVTVIYDARGRSVGELNDKIEGDLSPGNLAEGKRAGYNYAKTLRIKPGLYQVRIGVQEPSTGKLGTAIAWVEVPNLSSKKLAISGIVLADQPSGISVEKGNSGSLATSLPEIRQGIRFYKQGRSLVYDARLYSPSAAINDGADLMMQTEILEDGTSIKQSSWIPVSTRVFGKDTIGLDLRGQINLDLKPGIYELRLQLKDQKMKNPVQQTILFGVEN